MNRYSIFSLIHNAFIGHKAWSRAWRSPEPRPHYDVIVVGAGGHGLATAYYLAKEHGITNVAVLDKGWLGGGNTARNTTVIRSNYLLPETIKLYGFSHRLWKGLSRELNFNVMFSPRGILNLAHSRSEMHAMTRNHYALKVQGNDSQILDTAEVKKFVPILNTSSAARFPIKGGLLQRTAGTARHDAVAWGFARAVDSLGIDIIENCPVTGIIRNQGVVEGVDTSRGVIRAKKVAITVAGHSTVLAEMGGIRLPLNSLTLQAMVSEPLKPVLHTVIMSNTLNAYVSQSDKGELVLGGAADRYNSYAQRGSFRILEENVQGMLELCPIFGRVKLMRQWAGVVDISPDACPIIGLTPVKGLYINCGWGTGGFKATPGAGFIFADTIANNRPHPIAAPFGLNRFEEGRLIDENSAAGVAH